MQLRNDEKFRLPKVEVLKFKQSLVYCGATIWDKLPSTVSDSPSVNVFKKHLKVWLRETQTV